jgi:hypothetical protein
MTVIQVRRIALEALVDVRTLEKYLDGARVRPLSEARIERALRMLGLEARQLRRARTRGRA